MSDEKSHKAWIAVDRATGLTESAMAALKGLKGDHLKRPEENIAIARRVIEDVIGEWLRADVALGRCLAGAVKPEFTPGRIEISPSFRVLP